MEPKLPQSRRRQTLLPILLVAGALAARSGLAAQSGPVAVPDVVETTLEPMTILIDVLANDSHPLGAAMVVTAAGPVPAPAQGTVEIHPDGSLTLDLVDAGGLSQLSFPYIVTDSLNHSDTATVTVGSGGPGIQAVDDEYTVLYGTSKDLYVLANDVGPNLLIVSVTPIGAATIDGDGQFLTYTADALGTDDFQYTIQSGGTGPVSTATVHISVPGAPGGQVVPMGEVGEISNLTHVPQWVPLLRTYSQPVVIVQPPTHDGADASAVRLLAVEDDRFQVRLQEAYPGDDFHLGEQVSYLVVEAGRWQVGGGMVLEADTLVTDWTSGVSTGPAPVVSFSEALPASPIVLTQVESAGDPAWVTTRQGALGAESFFIGLQEEPPFADGHGAETVGWVAVTPGVDRSAGLDVAAAKERCTPTSGISCILPFGTTFGGAVRLLASVSSFIDDDTVELRREALFSGSAKLALEEPLGAGGQTGGEDGLPHQPEDVSLLAVGGDGVLEAVAINRPPRLYDDVVTVGPGGLSYLPIVLDPDPADDFWVADLQWVAGHSLPGGLSLAADGRTVLYDPPPGGFSGSGQLSLRVRDRAQGGFLSNWAVVTLSWDPGFVIDARDDDWNHIPDLVLTVEEDITFDDDLLLANDLPSQGLLVSAVDDVVGTTRGHAQITGVGPHGTIINYAAPVDPAEAGEDVFLYTASDETGTVHDTAMVTVLVLPGNQPPVAHDDLVQVSAGVSQVTIGDATLLANDEDPDDDPLVVSDWENLAALGLVTRQSDSFLYEPSPVFFYVGSDRFGYTAADPSGETDDALVSLQAPLPGPMVFEDFFDDGSLDAWSGTYVPSGGSLAVTPAAALAGSHGLAVTAVAGSTYVFATTKAPTAENHVQLFFQLYHNNLAMASGAEHVVASAVSGSGVSFDVRLGRTATGYQMRAIAYRDGGSAASTAWLPLGNKPAAVRAEWWAASEPGADDGGLRLSIDESASAEATGLDNDERVVETLRFGIVGGLDPGTVGTFYLDTVRLWRGVGALPVLLADPFEEGDLALWNGTYIPTGGSLDVTGAAAIEGNGGLAVSLVPGSTYAFANSPSLGGISSVTAFFRLDPASLVMAANTDHAILSVVSATAGVAADVRLGWTGTAHRLRSYAFPDAGAAQSTAWTEVPPGPVTVRLELTVAQDSGTGSMRLWINGQLAGQISGLANGSKLIEVIRFGAAGGVDATSTGTYYLDDFRSWGNE